LYETIDEEIFVDWFAGILFANSIGFFAVGTGLILFASASR
jgi:F0F1-type ATP synthase membrane subunit c/vacuolar-type H+-ATPase subunit K